MRTGRRFGHVSGGPEAERSRTHEQLQVRLRWTRRGHVKRLVRELTCAVCEGWHEVPRMGLWTCSSECRQKLANVKLGRQYRGFK